MRSFRVLPVLLALMLVLFSIPAAALEYGDSAPNFELTNLAGETVKLSQHKGKIIVLKLATTWCPTCKQQMEEIGALAEYLDDNGVVVLDVFLQDTKAMVEEYLVGKPHPKSFTALLDDGQVRKAYNVYLIPRLLVIDQDLKVRRDGSLITAGELKMMINGIRQGSAG